MILAQAYISLLIETRFYHQISFFLSKGLNILKGLIWRTTSVAYEIRPFVTSLEDKSVESSFITPYNN